MKKELRLAPPEVSPKAEGVPLGRIVTRRLAPEAKAVLLTDAVSAAAECYRHVANVLEKHADNHATRIVLVSSAVAGEGKTLTAMNTALALAENRDRRTLLLDADLRRPAVSRYLKPEPRLGLGDVIRGEAPLEHALLSLSDSPLVVLPAGEPDPKPLELLRLRRVRTLFEELRQRFDYVVVDTPPVVPFGDAAVVLEHGDAILLVVRARWTSRVLVQRAIGAVERGKLLGVVLNDVRATPIDRYYYGYDRY